MEIRCRHCGEYFTPSEDAVELMEEGFINSDSVNICDDCWDMINSFPDDLIDRYSDADPGL
jgi:hypothetical protein